MTAMEGVMSKSPGPQRRSPCTGWPPENAGSGRWAKRELRHEAGPPGDYSGRPRRELAVGQLLMFCFAASTSALCSLPTSLFVANWPIAELIAVDHAIEAAAPCAIDGTIASWLKSFSADCWYVG